MYQQLKSRLAKGEVVLLDGAIGTQLQGMKVPMNNVAWAAAALHTHPETVRLMHGKYVQAGADIITTNTYSSARHNLEPLGLGDSTVELNYRAVSLAQDARERYGDGREIAIAGSISHFGMITGGESEEALHRHAEPRSAITEQQSRSNLREQAECLAEAGVDFLLLEATGGMTHRHWMLQECGDVGLPLWLGFRCRLDPGDDQLRTGYRSATPFEQGIEEIVDSGIDGIAIFHSTIAATSAGIEVMKQHWTGPVATYPEADRADYTLAQRDESDQSNVSPEEFPVIASSWVNQGVQVIGGCCGINLDYITGLKQKLPHHIPR